MRAVSVAALVAVATATSEASECALRDASYDQEGSDWSLTFGAVPREAFANQVAAFTVTLPHSAETLAGAVHVPNGFGSSAGSIDEPDCEATATDDPEACTLWSETIYGYGPGGIAQLPQDDGLPAPQQVLLPDFAKSIWYSLRREAEWSDQEPGDVFTLAHCAE